MRIMTRYCLRLEVVATAVLVGLVVASTALAFVALPSPLPRSPRYHQRLYDAAAPRPRREKPRPQRQQVQCLTKIPSGKDPYAAVKKQTAEATQDAINAGIKLIELEFPPVRGKLDISLGETLDANRSFARELARSFSARMGKALWLVFPDDAEAELAQNTYGGTTFRVVGINSAIKDLKDEECQMQIVVNPGFDVNEWIVLDSLVRPDVPMVMLNGNLDKLRGGYYPRIFFPGLYNAKERFLKKFETVYYLKALPGGWIFRRAPEDWQVVSAAQSEKRGQRAAESKVLSSTPDRPDYNTAVKTVQAARREAGKS
ncbi:conserved unknown protein [Ectocarpus siliculosus]|uniref:DUF1995 domain-containing protein n=1 Tax=Ectocarpus siliculosus TaxID=2880 RepID=D7G8C6_ECTSI|nr:conserved unknown protein [Ectocarpus siliculosus]|eukprot:CBJ27978.1 conserved unknown protein [Ectocarpus siliculosus]